MEKDIEIARFTPLRPIIDVASDLNIHSDMVIPYGRHTAKIDSGLMDTLKDRPDGKLILVTAMSPTPSGEGKTTLTIGLAQSLKLMGLKVAACIRQPSLGPFFGSKGGATGSGYSQVLPAEEIALQFTGDDYAVVTAHNLIASAIDNHIYHESKGGKVKKLSIDPSRILWNRVSTVNDRSLRKVMTGLGSGNERIEEFHISAASEIMSVICLSRDLSDLRKRLERICVAYDTHGMPVRLKDLNIAGAITALLRKAIHPNLVQSVEGVPVFVHGGPFGNISIGCSSLMATRLSLKLSDYVLTEAGFATDLGAEKFFDIVCRSGGLKPSAAVIVATVKALRHEGGAEDYLSKNVDAVSKGFDNLKKHIENIRKFGVPLLVALNRFKGDTEGEIEVVKNMLECLNVPVFEADVRDKGGRGGIEAAKGIVELCGLKSSFDHLYPLEMPIRDKISKIATDIYGAEGVVYNEEASRDIRDLERLGFGDLPVCIAKTPKSLSDDPALLGRPRGFTINVRKIKPAAGAGFLVVYCGNVLLMPGFPEHPLAESIDLDEKGNITGV